ncbi:unnamed protein product [Microthlaspi erraticum]|uniref:Arabidopsis retrotransposon Orf1 C-terminal domain-containing protein n=1 Tax=Microthlaspi erraticum TaxID=1685480 RepID=A0A6D2J306_9BRAS|nr:unnamed protein product [Microthlaspi erraticum]
MRIEGEFGRANSNLVEPGRNKPCSAGSFLLARQKTFAPRTNRERSAAIGRNFRIGTDRPCRSIRETNDRPRPKSLAKTIWPTKSLDRDKIHRPSAQNFSGQGLSKLFKLECSEYSQLTKEFLSTVALAFPNHNGDQPAGEGLLLFKIGDANGRISISALCQLFGLPNETAHDFKENSKRKQAAFADWTHFANEPFLPSRSKVSRITHPAIRYVHRLISTTFQCKQEANKVTTDEFYILTTPFIKHEYKANLGLLLAKTFINVRKLAKDLEGNKKLCVRFGRLITAIVLHVGIDIPNYEPLPKPTPLDLHALQHIHFLNRWTKDPTRFCYEFPIGPANTSLVLLPHEDIPSLRSGVVTFQPNEEEFYVPSSEKPSFPMLTYRTLQHAVKTQRRIQERHVLTTGMAAHQALDRVNKLEKIVECQSRFISRLVRVVRHIAPERLFRPSSTAREPYEPDLGEFSLDSELGSEGDDPIDEEESSSHCHT